MPPRSNLHDAAKNKLPGEEVVQPRIFVLMLEGSGLLDKAVAC